ncbi:hypothetical protein D1872_224300 [compost metagenome]
MLSLPADRIGSCGGGVDYAQPAGTLRKRLQRRRYVDFCPVRRFPARGAGVSAAVKEIRQAQRLVDRNDDVMRSRIVLRVSPAMGMDVRDRGGGGIWLRHDRGCHRDLDFGGRHGGYGDRHEPTRSLLRRRRVTDAVDRRMVDSRGGLAVFFLAGHLPSFGPPAGLRQRKL